MATVDLMKLIKFVKLADEMANHLFKIASTVNDMEALSLVEQYVEARKVHANVDDGEVEASEVQDMPESESVEQDNSEVPADTFVEHELPGIHTEESGQE